MKGIHFFLWSAVFVFILEMQQISTSVCYIDGSTESDMERKLNCMYVAIFRHGFG